MVNQLKHLLLRLAQLPHVDQRWVLQQLPAAQLTTLNKYDGLRLLKSAQRFKKVRINNLPSQQTALPNTPLPGYCEELASKSPLYVAIVLTQGDYTWQTLFLERFDTSGLIRDAIERQVPDLKIIIKETLWQEWENSLSFAYLMESVHG